MIIMGSNFYGRSFILLITSLLVQVNCRPQQQQQQQFPPGQDPNAQPQSPGTNPPQNFANGGDPNAQLPPPASNQPTQPQPQPPAPAVTVPVTTTTQSTPTTTMAAVAAHSPDPTHPPPTEGSHSQPTHQSPSQPNSPPFTFQIPLPGSGNQQPNQQQPTLRFIPLGALLLSKFAGNQYQQPQQHG